MTHYSFEKHGILIVLERHQSMIYGDNREYWFEMYESNLFTSCV